MQQDQSKFDDPALSAALRRALGTDVAPPALRQRIVHALAAERLAESTRSAPSRWRGPLSGLAAAAVLLVGFGLTYLLVWRNADKPIATWFAAAMVQAHDTCSGANATHEFTNIQPGDLPSVRQKLRDQVGHPVLVTNLGDGWTLQGAGICKVSNVPAAHLLFTRGNESVSVFSISAAALYYGAEKDGTSYAQTEQGHQISGFVHGGAIHCVVGYSKSGKLSLKEATRIRERIRGAVAMADTPSRGTCGMH